MPPVEIVVGDYTLVPNPFFGGALFPAVVFAVLYAWPWIDRRWARDHAAHNLLERPRDNPRRTAAFLGFLTWVFVIFAAGASDRLYIVSSIPYEGQVWFFRAAAVVLPFVVWFVTRRVCEELGAREAHPLRGWTGQVVRRTPAGGFETLAREDGGEAGTRHP